MFLFLASVMGWGFVQQNPAFNVPIGFGGGWQKYNPGYEAPPPTVINNITNNITNNYYGAPPPGAGGQPVGAPGGAQPPGVSSDKDRDRDRDDRDKVH